MPVCVTLAVASEFWSMFDRFSSPFCTRVALAPSEPTVWSMVETLFSRPLKEPKALPPLWVTEAFESELCVMSDMLSSLS